MSVHKQKMNFSNVHVLCYVTQIAVAMLRKGTSFSPPPPPMFYFCETSPEEKRLPNMYNSARLKGMV